jgi:hypothetical protein
VAEILITRSVIAMSVRDILMSRSVIVAARVEMCDFGPVGGGLVAA